MLYAMCFYESPFDTVYQRGDSVALAVISGNVRIPDSSMSVSWCLMNVSLLFTFLTVQCQFHSIFKIICDIIVYQVKVYKISGMFDKMTKAAHCAFRLDCAK